MPLRLFASRERSGAYAARMLYLGAMIGFFYFTTQLMQDGLGFTPLQAGLGFLPMSLVNFAVAMAIPRLSRRIPNAVLLAGGTALTLVGMAWLSRAGIDDSYVLAVAVPMMLIGAGQGLAFAPLTNAGLAGVAAEDAGAASGLVNTAHQLGMALGLGILVAVSAHARQRPRRSGRGRRARPGRADRQHRPARRGARGRPRRDPPRATRTCPARPRPEEDRMNPTTATSPPSPSTTASRCRPSGTASSRPRPTRRSPPSRPHSQTGYRHIDTAAAYGNEREVGEAIRRSGLDRDEVFVETKVWISDYGYDATLHAFDKSAGKLGLDQIDLLILHQPMPAPVRPHPRGLPGTGDGCWPTARSAPSASATSCPTTWSGSRTPRR